MTYVGVCRTAVATPGLLNNSPNGKTEGGWSQGNALVYVDHLINDVMINGANFIYPW